MKKIIKLSKKNKKNKIKCAGQYTVDIKLQKQYHQQELNNIWPPTFLYKHLFNLKMLINKNKIIMKKEKKDKKDLFYFYITVYIYFFFIYILQNGLCFLKFLGGWVSIVRYKLFFWILTLHLAILFFLPRINIV